MLPIKEKKVKFSGEATQKAKEKGENIPETCAPLSKKEIIKKPIPCIISKRCIPANFKIFSLILNHPNLFKKFTLNVGNLDYTTVFVRKLGKMVNEWLTIFVYANILNNKLTYKKKGCKNMNDNEIRDIINKSAIPDFEVNCMEKLNIQNGVLVVKDAFEILQKEIENINEDIDEKHKEFIKKRSAPVYAYYKALLKNQIKKSEAIEMLEETLLNSGKKKNKNLSYYIKGAFKNLKFKIVLKNLLKKEFANLGFCIEKLDDKDATYHFKIKNSPYVQFFKDKGEEHLSKLFYIRENAIFEEINKKLEYFRKENSSDDIYCELIFKKKKI